MNFLSPIVVPMYYYPMDCVGCTKQDVGLLILFVVGYILWILMWIWIADHLPWYQGFLASFFVWFIGITLPWIILGLVLVFS